MSIEIIKKHLKEGSFAKLYLLYGDEDYLKAHYCKKIVQKAVTGPMSFNLQEFDDRNFNLSKVASAINNMPLMSEKKCVILKDIDPDDLKADEWKELKQILGTLPEECVTILHFNRVLYDKKSEKWKWLLNCAQKNGIASDIGHMQQRELERWVIKKTAEQGCSISEALADYLISTCGSSMNLLACEIDKLCAYMPASSIDKKDIDIITPRPVDDTIYDLARAVTGGNAKKALESLDELFLKKEEPVMILSALSGAFCDLYRAKTAVLSSNHSKLEQDFDYKRYPFRIRNAVRDCGKLELSFIRAGLGLLMGADEALKSKRIEKRVVLERLVIEIIAQKGKVHVN